jgi:hypothetical protein
MARPKKQETPSSPSASTPNAPTPPNAAADAFAKVEPELTALVPEEVAPVALDVTAAVTAVLAAVPRIHEHRAAIAEQLPKHPIGFVDNLETYAHAAWYAHLAHTYAAGSPEASRALLEEAQKLREGLLIAAEALAHRGLLNAEAVAKVRKGSGNADTANDLIALASLFSADWGRVSSKTAVERHEIDRAAEIGPAVMVMLAVKKHPAKNNDTEGQRARAFTLLSKAYDSCRQALAYLRWKEGDADALAPSLYRKRPGRKPGKKADEAETNPGADSGEAEAEAEAS